MNKKVEAVMEATIIEYALTELLKNLDAEKHLYEPKLYQETTDAIRYLRFKYHKIALTRMFRDGNGDFQILPDN
jgi:hypothetical protein